MVRNLAQVEFGQLGFASNGDFEDFITHYLIPQADKRIDSYCNHSFGTPTIGTWQLNGSGKSIMFLPPDKCPLIGVSAGTIDSSAITVSNLKIHDQFIEYDGGVFTAGKNNVTLKGSYGYATLPSDIEEASAMICANKINDMVRRKVLPDLFMKQESGATVVSATTFTKEIKESLESYVIKYIEIG